MVCGHAFHDAQVHERADCRDEEHIHSHVHVDSVSELLFRMTAMDLRECAAPTPSMRIHDIDERGAAVAGVHVNSVVVDADVCSEVLPFFWGKGEPKRTQAAFEQTQTVYARPKGENGDFAVGPGYVEDWFVSLPLGVESDGNQGCTTAIADESVLSPRRGVIGVGAVVMDFEHERGVFGAADPMGRCVVVWWIDDSHGHGRRRHERRPHVEREGEHLCC